MRHAWRGQKEHYEKLLERGCGSDCESYFRREIYYINKVLNDAFIFQCGCDGHASYDESLGQFLCVKPTITVEIKRP